MQLLFNTQEQNKRLSKCYINCTHDILCRKTMSIQQQQRRIAEGTFTAELSTALLLWPPQHFHKAVQNKLTTLLLGSERTSFTPDRSRSSLPSSVDPIATSASSVHGTVLSPLVTTACQTSTSITKSELSCVIDYLANS